MLPRISQVECNDANYLLFSTNDAISTALFKTGKWEEHLLKISKMFIHGIDAPLVIDVGANLGAYSIPLAKHIQPQNGEVIGFEPQRIIYYQLCANVFLNRLDNYFAFNSAVGDHDGIMEISEIDYENNINIGAFSFEKKYRELHGIEVSMKPQKHKIPLITLNTLNIKRAPSLIKIDVEGFELSVLKGGCDFLEKYNYPPILFEAWNTEWFKDERQELMHFINNLGYNITSFGTTDYIAQHKNNSVEIAFTNDANGTINMQRVK